MSKLMDAIDLRTQLVGENRLELLTFHLNGPQLFAMNVFKIQEVQRMPKISVLPHSHEMILGVTHARGHTIPIVDLARAIRLPPITDIKNANIIIAEYNMSVQGFMVGSVDRIVNMKWNEVSPPPKGSGKDHYLTAITRLQDRIVEIIDVEKILAEVKFFNTQISEGILQDNVKDLAKGLRVLIVDDSTVGLRQVRHVMEQLGVEIYTATNGNLALGLLNRWVQEGFDFKNNFLMMVTDAEMPEMDGYRLTAECRSSSPLKSIYIAMHTSLSGDFNKYMVEKVGCDAFISKFEADALAKMVLQRLNDFRAAQTSEVSSQSVNSTS